ncbi:MAG TPA: aconitase X, partial [Actinomycetota bacterium]|nr:aconitase X [Actinomycetota bacterium]
MPVELSERDRAMLAAAEGEAAALAMRILVEMAGVMGADRMIDVASAHVDGCLYHGAAGLGFAEQLVAGDARVRVPTTLNVGYLDLLHPERYRGDQQIAANARRQMDLYVRMGCRPTWTCAPYQLPDRPRP